tara:strand:- start:473 stop:1351 length:879 start_codon:yes stop_codon:yes gene_type:complete
MIGLFDIIIVVAVLITLLLASISDLKTREIPDWLSYGLLFFVISTRAIESILEKNASHIISTLIVFAIFFAFGSLMYFTRQWGGGDTKLIASTGAAFAKSPAYLTLKSTLPFPLILIFNILIIGAIYGSIYAIYLAVKHKKAFKKEYAKINSDKNIAKLKVIILLLAILLVLTSFIFMPGPIKLIGGIIALFLLLMPYIFISIKSVEISCMQKELKPSELMEGDWVIKDVMKGKKLLYEVNPYGIDKKSIEKLKKQKIKSVLVREGIPFVPSFLVGSIITLIIGEVLFLPLF